MSLLGQAAYINVIIEVMCQDGLMCQKTAKAAVRMQCAYSTFKTELICLWYPEVEN